MVAKAILHFLEVQQGVAYLRVVSDAQYLKVRAVGAVYCKGLSKRIFLIKYRLTELDALSPSYIVHIDK